MTAHDRAVESRKASVRAKVEHPFLIVKRDFAFTKDPLPPSSPSRPGQRLQSAAFERSTGSVNHRHQNPALYLCSTERHT
jgi:hypothetical protein